MSSAFAKTTLRTMMRRYALHTGQHRVGPMLPDWELNLHPALRGTARTLVADNRLRLHDYACALNSSQAFAMELFLPFVVGPRDGLEAFLEERLGHAVRVDRVELEFVGHGDLLAETHGRSPGDEEAITAADVAVHARDGQGRPGLILVEVKLTEGGFSRCSGPTSPGNLEPARCGRPSFLDRPRDCYLRRPKRASRDRRYWEIFEAAHGSMRQAFPGAPRAGACPFAGDLQQPMRNHALALAWCQDGAAEWWALALVHHDDNPDVLTGWADYVNMTHDLDRFHRWPATELLPAVDRALPGQADRLRMLRVL